MNRAPVLPATDCATMKEVRAGVDHIDRALVALIAERMTYMDAAARIKTSRAAVRDTPRVAEVIGNVRAEAMRLGVSPDLAQKLWETLVEESILHEFSIWDEIRS